MPDQITETDVDTLMHRKLGDMDIDELQDALNHVRESRAKATDVFASKSSKSVESDPDDPYRYDGV
tara:strand:- start:49855 stop:50052 length:198 start_codon:yes stop_codon:yes gene_type:complete